jgi:hypothetical protein
MALANPALVNEALSRQQNRTSFDLIFQPSRARAHKAKTLKNR